MPLCSFCGKNVPTGTGKIFIRTDGRILHFDKNKCEKNMLKLKRKPRNLKWTEDYERASKK